MWPCKIVSGRALLEAGGDAYEVIDKSMLLEFGPRKLSHVFSCALLGNIGCAANNLPPQS